MKRKAAVMLLLMTLGAASVSGCGKNNTTKTPPAAVLIKKACKIESGSGVPNKTKVATISKADLQAIAEQKMPDLNAASVEAAMSMIAGTCRSMGVLIGD